MAGAAGGFVTRAFEVMLKESSGKKFPSLQTAIQSYLDNVKERTVVAEETQESNSTSEDKSALEKPSTGAEESKSDAGVSKPISRTIAEALASAGTTLEEAEAELVLSPLRLAFETKNGKIAELALDCLHKLIAYDHLEGDPGLDGGKNAPLFTDILNMICSCVDNASSDSTILQVLKVLLTAVASARFRVHGESLLGVIRVCYNIALSSKSPINQATSKAMLTQMISIVFRRMESDLSAMKPEVDGSSLSDKDIKGTASGDALDSSQANNTSLASLEELHNLAGGADIKVLEYAKIPWLSFRGIAYSGVEGLKTSAVQGLEAVLDKAVNLEDGDKMKQGIDLESMSISQRDALLVFRTLCKMGMKEDTDDVTTKTRILSLELLQLMSALESLFIGEICPSSMEGLLEGVNHSFTKNFHFIDSVKAYLSYTLLRASVSSSAVIFQYAAGIFAVLLLRFRQSQKGEIGVLFPLIVLRSLDSIDFPNNQKLSVLRMLEKACKDPQMLVDIFVNYDCDLDAPNLFERMVTALSKIAQGSQTTDPNSVAGSQNASVKGSSLQCLVNVLKSLVDWEESRRGTGKQKDGDSLNELSTEETRDLDNRDGSSSDFEKAKAHKSIMEAAISEFNRKPAKGIEYLISNKLVENTPFSVAEFLKKTTNLDKSMIGDYLGQHEEFPLSVMHAYVDSMNFSEMKFDAAIRKFLNGFRLPGEAQKIDRIMEKFAERYCANNPSLFKNADTAYVLAYAVIMLNTDAHNPMVWPKMSKADFVRINTTNDAEESPPAELLEEIYDSIVKEEIKMKDDAGVGGKNNHKPEAEGGIVMNILNLALPGRKSSTDSKSKSEDIVKQTQELFRNQGGKRGIFYTSQKIELVRPMVETVGWPLLATFSVMMEEGDNKSRVVLCMEGFKAGIHITRVLGMDTMRYAFLTSLVRFTFLHAPKEMRSKNVEALRTLLSLCDSDTNSLQDTWNAVLECVSRLDYITSNPAIGATVMQASNQISRDSLLQSLRELAGKPAEQVFISSVRLPSDAVVEFFNALCGVSAEELKQSPARVFSLQKLVEISYYNMARIRLVWARIWSVLANHFISAGSHHDEKIAMYAIDSLRQLGMKYLERAELTNFTFQNDILKPFVVLMRSSRSDTKRKLIVDCIVQMIKSKVGSIKSGWRSVFMIFTAAADDESESIVESAFENVEQVILEHFDQVVGDCFMDCVNCLIGFANNKSSHRISLKAIALLRICEDRLAEGLVPGGALKPIDAIDDASFDMTEHYWFPMLAGLSDLTSDPRDEVRNCALEVLFDLLNERGRKFSSSFWESIFRRVLFPIFDHVRQAGKGGSGSDDNGDWLRETCIHSLQLLCNLFNTFYKEVCFMLPPLLSLLLDCAKNADQSVVSISLGALVHLIEVGGHQFSDNDWDTLLKSIRDASYATQPLELLNELGFDHANRSTLRSDNDSFSVTSVKNNIVQQTHIDASQDVANLDSESALADGSTRGPNIPGTPDGSEGLPSPSAMSGRDLQRNQTIGQRIMGNVMDNIFLRSFTSKPKIQDLDPSLQSQTEPLHNEEPDREDEIESPLMETIRGKCITQLLLLGAIDSIQKKYWGKLKGHQKVGMMEILLSMLDFAASYNSYTNLSMRIRHVPADRPPLNLLRQELVGTCIYLDMLQKATSEFDADVEKHSELDEANKLDRVAEQKLVTFCEHVLKEASDFQLAVGETTNMEIHRVLELRSPIIVKVIKGMSSMNNHVFRKHLREFYPFITTLVCCDQMDVRGALGDLFSGQLMPLLPLVESAH